MFASRIFALVAFAIAVAAADCGGSLHAYCCEKADGPYPKGYVGEHCAVASGTCPAKKHVAICCQQLKGDTAYFCGQPTEGGQ
ncbi:hypothetical protein BJ138DRAFT_1168825 [Hygrophoropsis aurantiaca]|uniref:Uncharacterized protein n=1 Tax=Hygrophoropsis aurantiaca TaxID=72124 RepID=A0ACB7ZR48_9AGAM|nr:hypothetical protein BJ138DRAFT_1168825 [Hygrophoropsis aurantiaca]